MAPLRYLSTVGGRLAESRLRVGGASPEVAGVTAPTRIAAVTLSPLNIPLHAPFGISGGAQAVANNVLFTIELADGTRGYGEAAPLPPYNGETQRDAIAALREGQSLLIGRDGREWRDLAAEFRELAGAACGSAQCALEVALIDALTRHDRIPLWKFFGGATTGLETDMTITTGSAAEAADAARAIRARGIRLIKVKIGGAAAAEDVARIAAIHEVAPDSPLILDGNAHVSRAVAGEIVRELKSRGITPALLEQWLPKDDFEGMRWLREESGWCVAADEGVASAADAQRIVDGRAADVVNIKLMKAGVLAALEVVATARAGKLGLMIGGNVESILAMTVSACFAAGEGGFKYADLDTPLFLAENPFRGGYSLEGGRISVAHITAGHGVEPGM